LRRACVLAVDVGGTSIKLALISPEGRYIKGTFRTTPVNSMGEREEILRPFIGLLEEGLSNVCERRLEVKAIGLAVPGPFDLERGISFMEHKFSSLYGLNLRKIIAQRLSLEGEFPIIFKLDSWAFVVGEAWRGAARGCKRIIGITLGMGLGSAFLVNDRIVTEGSGVPPEGWLWNLPYEGGILEDRVSRRGIIKRYKELTGEELDVKEIAFRGFRGDRNSLKVFEEVGLILGRCLKPIAMEFKPDCIVFGGQISKAFDLFKDPLIRELREVRNLKKIAPSLQIDLSPLYGITKMALEELSRKSRHQKVNF